MVSTVIILADGTRLSAGVQYENAIMSANLTESCNVGTELTLGSTCASMLELSLITPQNQLAISAGDQLTLLKVDDSGVETQIGIFNAERPESVGANNTRVTAYDNVIKLDKDLTTWLQELIGWPYSLGEFAMLVCEACGVQLVTTEFEHSNTYSVERFSAEGITGRNIIQWVSEIAGCFCVANAQGNLEFRWYRQTDTIVHAASRAATVYYSNHTLHIEDSEAIVQVESGKLFVESPNIETSVANNIMHIRGKNQLYYYQGSLSFDNYVIAPIQKVQLRHSDEDVGTVYPNTNEALNTYIVTGNYLLTANTSTDLIPIAQSLYERLRTVAYTPCTVTIPTNWSIRPGDIIKIKDRNNKLIDVYVMTRKQQGQKDTLECVGSMQRDSSSASNSQSFKALTGKVLNLVTSVEGLKVENKDAKNNITRIQADLTGLRTTVQTQNEALNTRVSQIEQTSDTIKATVQSITENGVDKVQTEFGLTIDESAVHIARSGSDMENQLDEKGMYVKRGSEVVLQADNTGVEALNISVRKFLIVGSNSRFEDFGASRTACFWIGR